MRLLYLTLFLCAFAPSLLNAQTIQENEEIPQRYIEEAADIQQSCQNDPVMINYYDCECRAVRFLEERIKEG